MPIQVTNDPGDVVHLFPALYSNQNEDWTLIWLSTRTGIPRVYELALGQLEQYPDAALENSSLPPGYSHRVAPTPTPGIDLGVWVQGPDGQQDISYRFFERSDPRSGVDRIVGY
jgi:hypothetical protein